MKHNVYICYAKEDRAAADTVCSVLENSGIKCWYAPRNLVSEGDRDAQILDAIRVSRIMVLIFSESANNSQQVLTEVSTAVQMGCLLIPIRISAACPTGALQYHLAAVQILNAQDGTLEEAAGKLAGMLDQFRERWYPDAGPVPEPVPVRAKGAMEGFEIQDGVLNGYRGKDKQVVIPEGVTVIGEKAFRRRTDLTSVTLPDSVTKIEGFAFENCENLISITIPDSVTVIEGCAFSGCESLSSITLPSRLMRIHYKVFGDCKSLASIRIPDSVTDIANNAFDGCTSLTSVIIPPGVEEISWYTFNECSSLSSVAIPNSVTVIGENAFGGCTGLTSITIPDSVTKIARDAFKGCAGLTSVTIPESVTKIGPGAFHDCTNIESIIIPDSVTDISCMFIGCPKLTIICPEGSYAHQYCEENHLPYIFDYQFEAFQGFLPQSFEKLASPFLADEEKPFIFISYSHKDRDIVLPIIKTLYESGWKIWYDEGLTIGDKYDETLETHVQNCAAFLLFISDHSLNSLYCIENEIPWAIKYDRPIIKCILDEGKDYEIKHGTVIDTVSPADIEPALAKTDGLSKGGRRVAKGISVVVDPANRDGAEGEGFAYCLYAEKNASAVRTIMLEARNSGCTLYDAAEKGEDRERLHSCACLIVFLDKAFLSDRNLTEILIEEYQSGKDMAVCNLEDIEDDDLPQELTGLHKMQWLNFAHGINADMNTKLARHLQKRGCRNATTLPGFEYEKTAEGIVIKRYKGLDPDPRIESEYGGISMTEIAAEAFENCTQIKSIRISEGVKRIGDRAFWGCGSMVSVTLPDSVETIGKEAFWRCANLISVNIPRGMTKIEGGTFKDCTSLASITIPDSITEIINSAFKGCESLVSVNIPDGITTIRNSTFDGCKSLPSIHIPESVKRIGSYAFNNCTGLTSIDIPDSVTEIWNGAFYGCTSLVSVTIPDSVAEIDNCTFEDCFNLSSVTIPDSVTKIGNHAFSRCTSLHTIVIPYSVTKIGVYAFEGCKNLTSITIPESITKISEYTFCNCTNLTSFTIPESVTEIDKQAFENCTNLVSVTIPESVTKIGEYAFRGCASLTEAAISGKISIIKALTFSGCTKLTSINIPDSVTDIDGWAFKDCESLTSINIPDSVKRIRSRAFENCINLTLVTIPDGVSEIQDMAFENCPRLTVNCSPGSYAWKYCMDKGIPINHPASGKGADTDKDRSPRRGFFDRLFGNKGK